MQFQRFRNAQNCSLRCKLFSSIGAVALLRRVYDDPVLKLARIGNLDRALGIVGVLPFQELLLGHDEVFIEVAANDLGRN